MTIHPLQVIINVSFIAFDVFVLKKDISRTRKYIENVRAIVFHHIALHGGFRPNTKCNYIKHCIYSSLICQKRNSDNRLFKQSFLYPISSEMNKKRSAGSVFLCVICYQ